MTTKTGQLSAQPDGSGAKQVFQAQVHELVARDKFSDALKLVNNQARKKATP
jgi:hypothetical protein